VCLATVHLGGRKQRNGLKRRETERNGEKRKETERNGVKRKETDDNETDRNGSNAGFRVSQPPKPDFAEARLPRPAMWNGMLGYFCKRLTFSLAPPCTATPHVRRRVSRCLSYRSCIYRSCILFIVRFVVMFLVFSVFAFSISPMCKVKAKVLNCRAPT
jgi:hypothetical protein